MQDFIAAYLEENQSYTLKILHKDMSDSARVDQLAERLKGVVEDTISEGHVREVVLDLTEVTMICSRLLSMFLTLKTAADAHRVKLTVAIPANSKILEALKIARLHKHFAVHEL